MSDEIPLLPDLFPHLSVRFVAVAVTLGLVGLQVIRAERASSAKVMNRFVTIFGFVGLVVPFVMTSAHENHLFLGTVFLLLVLGTCRSRPIRLASHLLLIIQFLNIYGLYGDTLYGAWPAAVGTWLTSTYSLELALGYALISIPCFLAIARGFLHVLPAQPGSVNSSPV